MDNMETIIIPVVGQTGCSLGTVYDIRNHTVTPGLRLWNRNSIDKHKTTVKCTNTKVDVSSAEGFSDRTDLLDINESIKLDLVCGFISTSGAGLYLGQSTKTKKTSRASLCLKIQTVTETLPTDLYKNLDNPDLIEEIIATHVIVGITYGARAVFDFELENLNHEKKDSEQKALEAAITKMSSVIDDTSSADYKEEDSNITTNTRCSFYGDFELKSTPSTFEEARAFCCDKPSLIDLANPVPVAITLLPLTYFDPKFVTAEVSDQLIQEVLGIVQNLEDVQAQALDFTKISTCHQLMTLKDEIEYFIKLICKFQTSFKSNLKKNLLNIKSSLFGDDKLQEMLKDINQSPFSKKVLDAWVTKTGTKIKSLASLLDDVTDNHKNNVKICTNPHQNGCQQKVVLQICTAGKSNCIFQKMGNFMNGESFSSAENTMLEGDFVLKPFDIELTQKFKSFALANKDNYEMCFLVSDRNISEGQIKEETNLKIILLQPNFQKELTFIPDKVVDFHVSETSQDTIQVCWHGLVGEEIEINGYVITVMNNHDFHRNYSILPSENQFLIKDLNPETNYRIMLKVTTAYGVSPENVIECQTKNNKNELDQAIMYLRSFNFDDLDNFPSVIRLCSKLLEMKRNAISNSSSVNFEQWTQKVVQEEKFKAFLQKWLHYLQTALPHEKEFSRMEMKELLAPFTLNDHPKLIVELTICLQSMECKTDYQAQLQITDKSSVSLNPEHSSIEIKSDSENAIKIDETHLKDLPQQNIITISDIYSIRLELSDQNRPIKKSVELKLLEKILLLDQGFRKVHPPKNSTMKSHADFLLHTLSMCDPFVFQLVIEKLIQLQCAVPIIFNKHNKLCFHLWGLRSSKKSWTSSTESFEMYLANHKMTTISFCRFGSVTLSKSKLINSVLSTSQSQPEHSFFLHKDNDKVSKSKIGSVEACWFCPDGRDKEKFKDIKCIYNLRGDCTNLKTQFKFLSEVSSILVVIAKNKQPTEEEEVMIHSFTGSIVYIYENEEEAKEDNYERNSTGISSLCDERIIYFLSSDYNLSELADEVSEHLLRSYCQFSIEDHARIAAKCSMEVDEFAYECQLTKEKAQLFLEAVKKKESNGRKSSIVPLQGNLWQSWAEEDKEESRLKYMGNKDPNKYVSEVSMKKMLIRKKQSEIGCTHEMDIFISQLLSCKSLIERKFFLEWCSILLDLESQLINQRLDKEYCKLKFELQHYQQNTNKPNPTGSKENEETISKKLLNIVEQKNMQSFGIEHVLREWSQIFESYESHESEDILKKYNTSITFPELMADLIILGYSLEIMDGDVSHIPINWVTKVLQVLTEKLQPNIKVLALSILGVQSCGKSTLLNAMFGCKFPVAAGRCTRGIFLKLVPVAEEYRVELNCDYFLIMDAEGLRSATISGNFTHDNEIATLVACLANITFITFLGDSISTEMRDILEIVCHAYARMQNVEVKSNVHTLFLRVSDVTASNKNFGTLEKVTRELDEIVKRIAKEENRSDLIGGFSAVFPLLKEKFSTLNFPEFLPTLWLGNMRAPDSKFGELSSELVNSVCQSLRNTQTAHIKPSSLSSFAKLLVDLWRAIKAESFVLGFKNTRQLEIFMQLEKFYFNEKSKMKQKCIEKWKKLPNGKELFQKHNDKIEAINEFNRNIRKVGSFTSEKDEVTKNVQDFIKGLSEPDFASNRLCILIKDLESSLTSWIDEEKHDAKSQIDFHFQNIHYIPNSKEMTKKKFRLSARKLAEKLKENESTVSEQQIRSEFDKLFQTEAESAQKSDQDSSLVSQDVFDRMKEDTVEEFHEKLRLIGGQDQFLNEAHTILDQIKNEEYFNLDLSSLGFEAKNDTFDSTSGMTKISKKLEKLVSFVLGSSSKHENVSKQQLFVHAQLKIFSSHLDSTASVAFEKIKFHEEISKILNDTYQKFSIRENDVSFTTNFQQRVLTFVYGYSLKRLSLIKQKYLNSVSMLNTLHENKEQLFQEFKVECQTMDDSLRTASRMVTIIFPEIITSHLKVSKGIKIYEFLQSQPELSHKNELSYQIFKELLRAPHETLVNFVGDYKNFAQQWIHAKVLSICKQQNYLESWIMDQISSCVKDIIETVEKLSERDQEEKITKTNWVNRLKKDLETGKKIFCKLTDEDILKEIANNPEIAPTSAEIIKLMKEESSFIESIFEELKNDASIASGDLEITNFLRWLDFNPLDELDDELLGCTDQCPICGAICSGGIVCKNEETRSQAHKADMHWPSGVTGRNWDSPGDLRLNNTLCHSICTVSVLGDCSFKLNQQKRERFKIEHNNYIPFKELNSLCKGIWFVQPDPTADANAYWQYLFVKHHQNLAKHYGVKEAVDIPKGWISTTEKDALRCLNLAFNKEE